MRVQSRDQLPGWSAQSIWGFDALLKCYLPACGRDDDYDDSPTIQISSYHLILPLNALARVVAAHLGITADDAHLVLIGNSPAHRIRMPRRPARRT
ncbi:hypothetical protein [Pengzhenrongella sicca]|uniref:Uncharacterized protein n=1 Tax=Pengzhenrongella sicca TaxID=2819238 RepID=A0A8A4ZHS1_9MICO|nr:hypothetical protein [Pengzhenrongella sicca]QTE30067.1 hypothetical protein J4E96_03320 [Pengzhenrongella sicca]